MSSKNNGTRFLCLIPNNLSCDFLLYKVIYYTSVRETTNKQSDLYFSGMGEHPSIIPSSYIPIKQGQHPYI